jgi:hypothetical protein
MQREGCDPIVALVCRAGMRVIGQWERGRGLIRLASLCWRVPCQNSQAARRRAPWAGHQPGKWGRNGRLWGAMGCMSFRCTP